MRKPNSVPTKMNAVVFDGELKFVKDYAVPIPGPAEALVRVKMAGICNTDLEILKGYSNFRGIPGHEFVGVVESAPEQAMHLIGKRVTGEINCGCGVCEHCMSGMEKHCVSGKAIGIRGRDGAFAEYISLPYRNLHVLPPVIADEDAVFVEPLAAACDIQQEVIIKSENDILVLGDGKLGLLCASVLNLTGACVTLAGKHPQKMLLAEDAGIRTIPFRLLKEQHVHKYDIVVEATGSGDGLMIALSMAKPRGTVVLKTTRASSYRINMAPVAINELRVVGSRCGPFKNAIELLAGKRVNVAPLVQAVYPIYEFRKAFKKAKTGEALKVLLDCSN